MPVCILLFFVIGHLRRRRGDAFAEIAKKLLYNGSKLLWEKE